MTKTLNELDFYATEVSAAATTEAITSDEAKAYARIDTTDEDTLIANLCVAARKRVEEITGRALLTTTFTLKLPEFPRAGEHLLLVKSPVQSITSITYKDTADASQTWTSSLYDLITSVEPNYVRPAYNQIWPDALNDSESVTVTYKGGYGDASTDVPEDLILAVKMLFVHMYDVRQVVSVGEVGRVLPMTLRELLGPYRIPNL